VRRFLLALGLAVPWTLGAWAQADGPSAAQKPKSSAAQSVALEVDRQTSRIYVKVVKSGKLGHDHGVQGQLESGSVDLRGSGTLRFAMQTFLVDSQEARRYVGLQSNVSRGDQQKTNATMLGPEVLNVSQYPTSVYKIKSISPVDGQAPGAPGRYRFEGELSLHGVGRAVPLVAQLEKTETSGVFRMRCQFSILQSEFGITPYSTLGGLVGVADRLEIWGELVLRPAS
jgi:polyisoprenoid-binding protein YceI